MSCRFAQRKGLGGRVEGPDGLGSPFKQSFWVRSDAQNRSHSLAESPTCVVTICVEYHKIMKFEKPPLATGDHWPVNQIGGREGWQERAPYPSLSSPPFQIYSGQPVPQHINKQFRRRRRRQRQRRTWRRRRRGRERVRPQPIWFWS